MEALPAHGPDYGHLAVPRANSVFATLVLFTILCTLTVSALFYARLTSVRRLFLADWFILLALIIYYGYIIAAFFSLYIGGIGWHITKLGTADLAMALKLSVVLQVTYAFSMGLLKVSICLMLMYIFATPRFRIAALVVMGFCVCWAIMTILIGFLLCRPLDFNWDKTIPGGHCGNQNQAYAAVGAVEIVADVMICALPLPMVWRLQTHRAVKVSLSLLFCLGLLTIAITGVRINALLNVDFNDFTYSGTDIYVWTTVEWGIAIIVACGPGLKPLVDRALPQKWNTSASGISARKRGYVKEESDQSGGTVPATFPWGGTSHSNTHADSSNDDVGSKIKVSKTFALSRGRQSDSELENLDDEEIALTPQRKPQNITSVYRES